MKIAIFHNYMDNIGGAERVVLTLARELKADIFTTNLDNNKIKKMGFSNINVKSIGKIPLNPPYRQQLSSLKFRLLKLKNEYDFFIIAGDWAMSGVVNNKPNLLYVHSPIREIWDLYEYSRQNNVHILKRPLFDLWVKYNRYLSKKYIKNAGLIVSNSKNTQKRVKKYLNLESTIINPPVDTSKYKFNKSGNYWLSVNRLINHKRIEMQINAFKKLPKEKLIIVGSYEQAKHFSIYSNYLNRIKTNNVELIHWVDQKKLQELYSQCKGFITTSQDEDFGMTAVEAMASGKPVIAPNEGGYQETIVQGVTGHLIDNIDEKKLIKAVLEVGKNPKKYKKACLEQAKKFDTKIFINKIKKEMKCF